MSYPTHPTWERLSKAVNSLATGTGNIQRRLYYAALDLAPLKLEEFPEELRDNVSFVYKLGEEVSSEETTNNLTDENARKLAEQIVNAYDIVAREYCTPDK